MSPGLSILALLLAAVPAAGPAAEPAAGAPLEFGVFVLRVLEANPDLAAARANLPIAEAQIEIAKELPDPQLSAGLNQYDVTGRGNPPITEVQVTVPIELGGKRSARVAVARAGVEAARFDYDESVRALRAAAANSFADSLRARLVLAQKERVLANLQRLVSVNEKRLAAGDVAEVALLQSRVEAQQFRSEVLAAEGERRALDLALLALLGPQEVPPRRLDLAGDLRSLPGQVDAGRVVATVERRPDVLAAAARADQAARQVSLEEAKRVIDVSVGVGWQHVFPVGGSPGAPSADLVVASLAIPLPFSRVYRGELDAAAASRQQAENQLRAVRARAESEVRQALARFEAAAERVALYDSGVLGDARSVLEKTLYNYERGGATIVDVLIAQRTESDVNLAYFDALADRAHALATVEQASGLAGLVRY